MKLYPLFLLMASLAVLSPGPGVVMTISNSLRYGLRGAFLGIVGISLGALAVASISATGLGLLITSSPLAYTTMKWTGAAWLIYLGIKLALSQATPLGIADQAEAGQRKRLIEGASLQLTNPKAIAFFLSVLPQFVDASKPQASQFCLLALSYSLLVIIIHCAYALFAGQARGWLTSERGARLLNVAGAITFCCFGITLIA